MTNWFECSINYEKMQENGTQKKATEPYLVDALSFTEAETRIIEEMKPYIAGEFTVKSIKRAKISELFLDKEGDKFFKVKVSFVTLDEKSGNERKTSTYMIVQSLNIESARMRIEEEMKGTLSDFVIEELKETKLMDVFPYIVS